MPERIEYTHPEGAETMRADKALAAFLSDKVSRSKLLESFAAGKVKMGGQPIVKKQPLSAGDVLEVELPEPPPSSVEPVEIPVEILYEDDDVVVVNKPAGMTVHPGSGTGNDTLVHAMTAHCKLSLAGGAMRPGIVHRLDKETSGAMILAKTDAAYYALVNMFSERELEKEYLALISGVPSVRSGCIKKNIGRHPSFRTKMCVCDDSLGRDAYTEWFVEQKFGAKAALVRCKIHTGRTHQIRVHMTDLGFPILGDYSYKFQKNKFKEIEPPPRVMLHAEHLRLPHPVREGVEIDVRAPLPPDFQKVIADLTEHYAYEY